jgi:hypothetical protein
MKLTDTMENIKFMNMELKGVASRQETSDMETVIPRTTHQMQADGNVCRRARVLSGLKVKLCVSNNRQRMISCKEVARRLETPLIVQRRAEGMPKSKMLRSHMNLHQENIVKTRGGILFYVTNQNLKETESHEEPG